MHAQAVLLCERPASPPLPREVQTFKPPATLGALERPGLNPVRKVGWPRGAIGNLAVLGHRHSTRANQQRV